jgi:hypothetical protein
MYIYIYIGAAGHDVAFIHPKSATGVLVELIQHPDFVEKVNLYAFIHTYMCIGIYIYVHICICVCVYEHIFVYTKNQLLECWLNSYNIQIL